MKRIYCAGPMSGLPESNYPAFHAATKALRQDGYHVENPAENPDPPCKSWRKYMELALKQLVTCEAIFLLEGWSFSKGAYIEYKLAKDLDMEIMFESPEASWEEGEVILNYE